MTGDANRSVSLYYADVAKTAPIEDPEEERRLILNWQRHKDASSRNKLVQSHLRFVIKLARKRTTDPDKLPDLIAAGNLGLLKAIDRFDVRKRTRFLTYAGWWIQEEMFREDYTSSTLIHVPAHRQKAQRRRTKEYNKALAAHGPTKAVQELHPGSPEGATVPIEVLWDIENNDPTIHPEHFNLRDADHRVRRAVSDLPTREQTVLNLYFGTKDDPRNFVQIANLLGMSAERVRQIKINGMNRLSETLRCSHALQSSSDVY